MKIILHNLRYFCLHLIDVKEMPEPASEMMSDNEEEEEEEEEEEDGDGIKEVATKKTGEEQAEEQLEDEKTSREEDEVIVEETEEEDDEEEEEVDEIDEDVEIDVDQVHEKKLCTISDKLYVLSACLVLVSNLRKYSFSKSYCCIMFKSKEMHMGVEPPG